ncbi:MAG: hypothetical protein JWQ42_5160 [Edaphobacter sp.]|nr:hypothetical protein [Edaphobacter sp.]
MLEVKRDEDHPTRRFCVGRVPFLEDVQSALDTVSANYCLFLAADATSISDEKLRKTAKLLLEQGIAYLCVWGPDCERVHDLFDLERMPNEPRGRVVMTTWHSKESLSEALWFFENCVEPDDGFEADCTDWIALSVKNDSWGQQIRTALID